MIDMEVIGSAGFVILAVLSLGATIIGYTWSIKSDLVAMSIWQLIFIMGFELVACYYFASRQ